MNAVLGKGPKSGRTPSANLPRLAKATGTKGQGQASGRHRSRKAPSHACPRSPSVPLFLSLPSEPGGLLLSSQVTPSLR